MRRRIAWGVGAVLATASLGAVAQWSEVAEVVNRVLFAMDERPTSTPPAVLPRAAIPQPALKPTPALDPKPEDPAEVQHEPLPLGASPAQLDATPAPPSVGVARPMEAQRGLKAAPPASTNVPPQRYADHAPRVSVFGAELEEIAAARAALSRADYLGTRALLDEHVRKYPVSKFAIERRTMQVLIACLHDGDQGPARAFLSQFPKSLFTSRIIKDCQLRSKSVPPLLPPATHSIDGP